MTSTSGAKSTGDTADRIDLGDDDALARWAGKFDASVRQIRDAVAAVGDSAADVEMHLKGSHSSTNADRVHETGDGDGGDANAA